MGAVFVSACTLAGLQGISKKTFSKYANLRKEQVKVFKISGFKYFIQG